MLKIEVIKFEAQDVITASNPAPDQCTCSPNEAHYHFANDDVGTLFYDHGDCTYEGEHNCIKYKEIN